MISVIIPVYNRPAMLSEAIASVLRQTCRDFELIVVDDGSTEDLSESQKIVEQAGHNWIQSTNRGVSAARNLGVLQSSKKYLAFLDSDDYWLPKKLEMQIRFFESNRGFRINQTEEVWYRNGQHVNPCKHHQKPQGDAFSVSLMLCAISPSAVMLERELFQEVGGFDEDLMVCEDYDLWLRISARYPVGLVEDRLVCKRGGHNDQLSHSLPAMDRFRVYSMLKVLGNDCLSDAQKVEVIKVLRTKVNILLNGAKKRENGIAKFWTELQINIERNLSDQQWKILLGQCKETLTAALD